ncbi:MAG: type VI secretion system-associated FHA domain protein TagH [Loktanella sp.]|nr:type VI secretion system-associated FHA domain protein TagH [Loktanella sp.]
MTLTLRIENITALEDGGPTWLALEGRGASVGRKRAMDWVLPDPSRHVSGHHFDIGYRDGVYSLTDLSTNGTFIEGTLHRLQGAVPLRGGERLLVGPYVIAVHLSSAAANPGQRPAPTPDIDEGDPWDFMGGAPIPPPPPQRHQPVGQPPVDFGNDFMSFDRPQNPPSWAGEPGDIPQMQRPPPQPGAGSHALPSLGASPFLAGGHPTPPAVQAPPQPPQPDEILKAFCAGAGLDPSKMVPQDAAQLAHALGQSIRVVTDEVMRMLRDRANVKQFTKGGERTMRAATKNNPLKFLPDTDQALDAMFLNAREGYMTGPEALQIAMQDLRAHQMGVFSALQPALASVLDGLSPEDIDKSETAGNLLSGSRKGKMWDEYVRRWDEKAHEGEHGMLDAFLAAFAQAYAEANKRKD